MAGNSERKKKQLKKSEYLNHLNIIREFAIEDFKIKYKNSIIGYFWSLLNPLLMLVTLYIVFSLIMKLEVPHYQLFLLLGIILWNFISETTANSMDSIISKGGLIKKINFPAYTIIISSCIASVITLVLNLLVFFIFMAVFKVRIGSAALFFPLYLAELVILVTGLSFMLSGLYIRIRDLKYIWSFLLLIGFWITPIVYPETRIPDEFRKWYMLNPMARIINGSRDALIYNFIPEAKQVIITSIICLLVFLIGLRIFRNMAPKLAEEV
ncbi:MAG: ABC transporter permease [Candidatus Woesearchaeota archaeon]|nr:ABC transporter permease [Candidatus Woesearchaeota archaeon]